MAVFSLRIPDSWSGRVDSGSVRAMLVRFLQQPRPLGRDPGPGEAKISLSLPKRAVKVISGLLDDTDSGALRRVIANQLPMLRAAQRMSLPVLPERACKPTSVLPTPALSLPALRPPKCPHCAYVTMPAVIACQYCGSSERQSLSHRMHVMQVRSAYVPAEVTGAWMDLLPLGVKIMAVVGIGWLLWKKFGALSAGAGAYLAASNLARNLPRFKSWMPEEA